MIPISRAGLAKLEEFAKLDETKHEPHVSSAIVVSRRIVAQFAEDDLAARFDSSRDPAPHPFDYPRS